MLRGDDGDGGVHTRAINTWWSCGVPWLRDFSSVIRNRGNYRSINPAGTNGWMDRLELSMMKVATSFSSSFASHFFGMGWFNWVRNLINEDLYRMSKYFLNNFLVINFVILEQRELIYICGNDERWKIFWWEESLSSIFRYEVRWYKTWFWIRSFGALL